MKRSVSTGWEGDNLFDFKIQCDHSPLSDQKNNISHFLMKIVGFFFKLKSIHHFYPTVLRTEL